MGKLRKCNIVKNFEENIRSLNTSLSSTHTVYFVVPGKGKG